MLRGRLFYFKLVRPPEAGLCKALPVALAGRALSAADVRDLIDYLCRVGIHQRIFFLWRPMLRDPNDDMVAEVAVAASCTAIVTHNVADFVGVEKFGIVAVPPAGFLQRLRRTKRVH
jgi:predicted nucleic acid-binding protein